MDVNLKRLRLKLLKQLSVPMIILICAVLCFHFTINTFAEPEDLEYEVNVVYHYINNLDNELSPNTIGIKSGFNGSYNSSNKTYSISQSVKVVKASTDLFPVAEEDLTDEVIEQLTSYKIDLIDNPFDTLPVSANGLTSGYINALTNWVYGDATYAYTNWNYAIGSVGRYDGDNYSNPDGLLDDPNYYVPTGEYVLSATEVEQLKASGNLTIHFYGYYGKIIYASGTGNCSVLDTDGCGDSTTNPIKPTVPSSGRIWSNLNFVQGDIFSNSIVLVGDVSTTTASTQTSILASGTKGFTITSISKNAGELGPEYGRYQLRFPGRGLQLTESETVTNSVGADLRISYVTMHADNYVTPIIFSYQHYLFVDAGVRSIGHGNAAGGKVNEDLTSKSFYTQTGTTGAYWIGLFGSYQKGMRVESGLFRRVNGVLGGQTGKPAPIYEIGGKDASNPVVLSLESTGAANGATITDSYVIVNGYVAGTGIFGGGLNASLTNSTKVEVRDGSRMSFGSFSNGKKTESGGLFGGCRNANVGAKITMNIADDVLMLGHIFGGNNEGGTATGTVDTTIGAATIIGNVYVGGNIGKISGSGSITLNSTLVKGNVYGAGQGSAATQSGNGTVTINNATIIEGYLTTGANAFTKSGGNIYGGGAEGPLSGNASIIIQNSTVLGDIYGGGNAANVGGNTVVNIKGDTDITGNIYGGGNAGTVGTSGSPKSTTINIEKGTITGNIYGGGKGSTALLYGSTNLTIGSAEITGNIYGGGDSGTVSSNSKITLDGTVLEGVLHGGGNGSLATLSGNTEVIIRGGSDLSDNVFGGGSAAKVVGNSSITILESSTIGNNIYGGGDQALLGSNSANKATITIDNSTVNGNVYGGGNTMLVTGSSYITTDFATINGDIFGGGDQGNLSNTSNINLKSTAIDGTVYGGGNAAEVLLSSNITLSGSSSITGNIYGGGNEGNLGQISAPTASTSTILITGAEIEGSIFGGGRTSVVYGNTIIKIGKNAVNNGTLATGDINIKGSIFGGGDVTLEGGEDFNFDFISVKNGVNIEINGIDHGIFQIDGSFFGSGNASSVEGTSTMLIKNYGTSDDIKLSTSFQRTDNLTIDNSYIELIGVGDRTNKYSKSLFSISRIKDLTISNGTNLYLQNGSNLLEKWTSKENDSNATINTSNRIYIAKGKNLTIATNEDASSYGRITGLTFLGMYDINTKETGIYSSNLSIGDTPPTENINSGTYVLGLHSDNYQIDGFVTNFITSDLIDRDYIYPKPDDLAYHLWQIGEEMYSYDISLTASKYSVLGKYGNLSLPISLANTVYSIESVDTSGLADGVALLNPNMVSDVYNNEEEANNNIGIIMKTGNVGWTSEENFYFLDNNYVGSNSFQTENVEKSTNLEFYVVNAKNINTTDPRGYIIITLKGRAEDGNGEEILRTITITVNISSAVYADLDYESQIANGYKFTDFGTVSTTITNQSSFSSYFSTVSFSESNPYQGDYKRTLKSSTTFPVNTKITMIDLSNNNPDVYYYIVSDSSKTNFELNDFLKMGSLDEYYSNSKSYYDSNTKLVKETFIFIVDFIDCETLPTNQTDSTLLLDLRDSTNSFVVEINATSLDKQKYSVYNGNSDYTLNTTQNKSILYTNDNLDINVKTTIVNSSIGGQTIFDTTNQFNNAYINVYIKKSDNTTLTGKELFGTTITLDGIKYYPDSNGLFNIKLSENMVSVSKNLNLDISGKGLETGSYVIDTTFVIGGVTKQLSIDVTILNYGLQVSLPDNAKILKHNSNIPFTIDYSSTTITDPNIRVKLYKNDGTNNYELINLEALTNTSLTSSKNSYEYLVTDNPLTSTSFILSTKDVLIRGGYKFVFSLYDGDNYIGDVSQSVVVK